MFPLIRSSKYAIAHTADMTAGILPASIVAVRQPATVDKNCIIQAAELMLFSLSFPSDTNHAAPADNRNVSSKLIITPIATLIAGFPVCVSCLYECFFIRHLPFRFILFANEQKNTRDFSRVSMNYN
jgi:hypothetical protein